MIGTGCTAEAQIDTPGVQRLQRTELLGDHQRRMVRQHHATGTKANALGTRGQITQQYRGGGTADAGHVVMLCQPIALITPFFGMLC
ncbi:hypothetical protein D3C76_1486570 [compost metagenome]